MRWGDWGSRRLAGPKVAVSAKLVEGLDLDVERLVLGPPAAVWGHGDAMSVAAGAGHFDRPGVRRGILVNLEATEGAGGLAAEGDHPTEILGLGGFLETAGLGHSTILADPCLRVRST